MAFRQINFTPYRSAETKKEAAKSSIQETVKVISSEQKATLIIDNSVAVSQIPINTKKEKEVVQEAGPGLGALKKIREQIQNKKLDQAAVHLLSDDLLTTCWTKYLERLQENSQVTSHSNLRLASLHIVDEKMFEIIAESRIQQQFIENERIPLLSFVHDFFNDRKIQIRIILNPDSDKNETQAEQTLSQKEQYIKMVTMYPIIKELRDKLNLDLDY